MVGKIGTSTYLAFQRPASEMAHRQKSVSDDKIVVNKATGKVSIKEIDLNSDGATRSEFNKWFNKKFNPDSNHYIEPDQLEGYAKFFGLSYGGNSNFSQWWNLGAALGTNEGLDVNSAAMKAWKAVTNNQFGISDYDTLKNERNKLYASDDGIVIK